MAQPIRARATSKLVAQKPGCAPLKAAYEQAIAARPKSWSSVQDLFIKAMEAFDANVASGLADMGDLQNGKGDFFNDLLALLLENCAGVQLYSRGKVPGLIIPRHNLDVTFPRQGPIEFLLEAKALGTPKHPGSPSERPIGRGGSADVDKRIKEIGFKTIDLKAEYARILAGSGTSPSTITGDLTAWLRSVKPRSYVFLAARVISDADHSRLIRLAEQAALVSDAVGVFCFRPVSEDQPTIYRPVPVPAPLELSRVLFRACQDLTSISKARPDDI
ncbi:MAG TPA: hypothetical protein VFV71_07745 [Burkholderiales bacterium]|nr:hypothetical protein [Burkholderiales bacterium]